MTKYIVKNCPAYIINGHCALNGEWDSPFDEIPCKDRTDCPIRQVVKICWVNRYEGGTDTDILEILDIEEVE